MGSRRKKSVDNSQDTHLDVFLKKLEIADDKREKIVKYIEDLTFGIIARKTAPKLRLNK